MSRAGFDTRTLRDVLGAFPTGVAVVTTMDGSGHPVGFTANSFTSVSLNPPLVLVCIGKDAVAYQQFETAPGYAVNILAAHQQDVSNHFAQLRVDLFGSVEWSTGPAGNPLLPDTAAWLDCSLDRRIDAGDHLILVGQVAAFDDSGRQPLGFCRGAYVACRDPA